MPPVPENGVMLLRVVAVPVMWVVLCLAGGCTTESPPAEEPGTTDQWAMPDLVGETLQDAQDQIQELTDGAVLISVSHDLTGKDRSQVLDRNWRVCTQNIAPGEALTTDSEVDFGVVKLEESCP